MHGPVKDRRKDGKEIKWEREKTGVLILEIKLLFPIRGSLLLSFEHMFKLVKCCAQHRNTVVILFVSTCPCGLLSYIF